MTRIVKNGEEITKTNILQLIENTNFLASSISNLVNNLSEGIQKLNVNTDTMIKYAKLVELNTSIAAVFLNT